MTAVNDPPAIVPPAELNLVAGGVLFVLEDETSPLGAFGVSDVDDVFLRVTVSAQVGSVRTDGIDQDSMLVVTFSDEAYTAATGSRTTFEGTSDEVSAALGNLTYTSSLNWNSLASKSRDVVEVSRARELSGNNVLQTNAVRSRPSATRKKSMSWCNSPYLCIRSCWCSFSYSFPIARDSYVVNWWALNQELQI